MFVPCMFAGHKHAHARTLPSGLPPGVQVKDIGLILDIELA